ncbi:trehalose-phosphatase [Alteromonas gracilis]
MEFLQPEAETRWRSVRDERERLVVGLDFDGVLSPIVEDPSEAHIHPDGPARLEALATVVRRVAVITGRPARQALALGDLDEVGATFASHERELVLLGQYGNERWTSHERRVISPAPPKGLASFERDLPRILRGADAEDAWLEEKGLALGIHTRRCADPAAALERLREPVTELAERHGLSVEPGRMVLEVRAPGMDKGQALRRVVADVDGGAVLFVGDDLGDVTAFEEVARLREEEGLIGLCVYSRGQEVVAPLRERADVEVDGPDGVMALLADLA